MSCISKILEVKSDKEFLMCEGKEIVIEGGGIYRDYEYLVIFVDRGHRCGYVAISSDHPIYKFHNPEYNYPDIHVHGGITFFGEPRFDEFTNGHTCDDKWIGFDAAHYRDDKDIKSVGKYFGENKENVIKLYYHSVKNSSIKSYDYMENECKKLIDQLIRIKNNGKV